MDHTSSDLPHNNNLLAAQAQAEAIALAEALHTIVRESDDAETIRVAIAALQATVTGRSYIRANPIGY